MLLGTLTEVLDFGPSAPMAARRIVADVLDSWGLDHHATAAQLCTTELVTDALRIGEPPLVLVILHWTDRLLVTIVNAAEDHDRSYDPGPYSESRVRTRIIEGLSVTWGVEPMATGMAAWFDLDTQPPPTPLRVNNGKSASRLAPDAGLPPHAFN